MPIFLIKSLLSCVLLLLTFIAMGTMFEIFGRAEKRLDIENLKKFHRFNGKLYFLLYLVIAYLCLDYIMQTKGELSARATFHSVFALAVIVLFCVKIAFIRRYKQFYSQGKTIGLLIALMTFGMIATSGGYYLLITEFGTDSITKKIPVREERMKEEGKIRGRTDAASIIKGKALYEAKCSFCHDAGSNRTMIGPGHKGILKNPVLPVSRRPATPENIIQQLKNPFMDMPSFSSLSDDDTLDLIAFLSTL